jgi:outer membrane protein OmpA-like peptidoglycan-associated protein
MDLSLQYKLNNGYILKEEARLAPYLLVGLGMNVLDMGDFSPNAYAPLGLGLKIWAGAPVTIDVNAAYKADISGNLQDYFTVNTGLIFNFGKGRGEKEVAPSVVVPNPDRDNDGIVDALDDCPDTPGLPERMGCPDRDADGIIDREDNCPDVAGVAENEGCPADADRDGVPDTEDQCPNVAGLASMAGCPDTDGDGIANRLDDCPDVAGLVAFNGCPDTDGDGIIDAADKCPQVAGTAELMGCPEVAKEVREKLEFATKAVQFETGSNVLKKSSYALLDTIVNIMNQYPEYSLRASGHTDSVGDATKNQELSQKRARACIDYLVGKGMDPERLVSIGYGESQPVADNINAVGRAKNRRVEFDLFVK